MTRIGPRIKPITSPTAGGCATSYATDAGLYLAIQIFILITLVIIILTYKRRTVSTERPLLIYKTVDNNKGIDNNYFIIGFPPPLLDFYFIMILLII